jgi:hypothetical protein
MKCPTCGDAGATCNIDYSIDGKPCIECGAPLEIDKMLTLSTTHITAKDVEMLAYEAVRGGGLPHSYSYENGCIINVPQDADDFAEFLHDVITSGYSPQLITLLRLAKQHSRKFIRLDCDGPVVEVLPQFNW